MPSEVNSETESALKAYMNTMTALLNSGEIDAATVLSDFRSLGEAYDRADPDLVELLSVTGD